MMTSISLADLARVTAEDFVRSARGRLPSGLVPDLAAALEIALLTAMREERRACVAECDRRAALWDGAFERADASEIARREAQSRGNEARYLADLIAARAAAFIAPSRA
jgi:hypothetical protein